MRNAIKQKRQNAPYKANAIIQPRPEQLPPAPRQNQISELKLVRQEKISRRLSGHIDAALTISP